MARKPLPDQPAYRCGLHPMDIQWDCRDCSYNAAKAKHWEIRAKMDKRIQTLLRSIKSNKKTKLDHVRRVAAFLAGLSVTQPANTILVLDKKLSKTEEVNKVYRLEQVAIREVWAEHEKNWGSDFDWDEFDYDYEGAPSEVVSELSVSEEMQPKRKKRRLSPIRAESVENNVDEEEAQPKGKKIRFFPIHKENVRSDIDLRKAVLKGKKRKFSPIRDESVAYRENGGNEQPRGKKRRLSPIYEQSDEDEEEESPRGKRGILSPIREESIESEEDGEAEQPRGNKRRRTPVRDPSTESDQDEEGEEEHPITKRMRKTGRPEYSGDFNELEDNDIYNEEELEGKGGKGEDGEVGEEQRDAAGERSESTESDEDED